MNRNRLKQYLEIFILAASIIVFYKMFDSISTIFKTFIHVIGILKSFIVGGCLAYLLYPFVDKVEDMLDKSNINFLKRKKFGLSVLIVFFIFIFLFLIMMKYLIPVLVDNVIQFIDKLGSSYDTIIDFVDKTITEPELNIKIHEFLENTFAFTSMFHNIDLNKYLNTAISSVGQIFNFFVGFVICPYILIERKNLVKIFDNVASIFISGDAINKIHYYAQEVNTIFSKFIYGKAIDSLIIGVIAFIGFSLLHLKFALVYAVAIGLTNMIPYFGPFIGGIPVTLIVFITEGFYPAIACGIFVFALQQFDGLLLGPAILGDSLGVSPFWIIFAITFFGGCFGVLGMFIGVPLIAVIRMFLRDYFAYRKKKHSIS